jgi:outer membrane protein OmpA-like peptidoglycan-associated protein
MKYILIFFLVFLSKVALTQNLVFNPDFENTVDSASCTILPASISEFSVYMGRMRFPGRLIPPPSILFGKYWMNNNTKLAHSGKFCGGNVFYKPGSCKGLVSMTLVEKLKSNETYVIEFYIRNLAGSYYINNIDVGFSKYNYILNNADISYSPNVSLNNINRLVSYLVDSTIDDNWHKIHLEYKANGGEKSFMVGGFGYPKKFKKKSVNSRIDSLMGDYSVYIIDDALVMTKHDFEVYEFENSVLQKSILYDLNSYEIRSDSKKTLDSLVHFMVKNDTLTICLSGYTDPSGMENANIKLSYNRAESAKKYLMLKGISSNRIKINTAFDFNSQNLTLPKNKYYLLRRIEYQLK